MEIQIHSERERKKKKTRKKKKENTRTPIKVKTAYSTRFVCTRCLWLLGSRESSYRVRNACLFFTAARGHEDLVIFLVLAKLFPKSRALAGGWELPSAIHEFSPIRAPASDGQRLGTCQALAMAL